MTRRTMTRTARDAARRWGPADAELFLSPAQEAVLGELRDLADVDGGARNVKAEIVMAKVRQTCGWAGGTTRGALRVLTDCGLVKRAARGYYRPLYARHTNESDDRQEQT